MKINPSSFRRILALSLLAPLALGLASAAATTDSSAQPATASTSAKPAPAKTKPAASTNKTTTDTVAKTKTPSDVTQLPTVVVTAATRDTQPVETTATSTTVITRQDLTEQKYANVVDALTTVPGLTVATRGTPGQAVSVFSRGADSASTLLTIDGRRQAPDLTGFYDFANLTLDNVDQIEVVRTPSSALVGGNSIGGVINLVTLNGRGVDRPEGSVGFEAGSFDTVREIAQSRGAVGNFDYGVGFSRQDSHFPGQNHDYSNTTYRGNYGYAITPDIYFDVQTSYNTSNVGSPGPTNFGVDPVANLYRETWNISPRITAKLTDFFTSTFYYNRTQLRQTFFDSFGDHNRTQINTDSIDWQNDFQVASNWKITAGIQGDNQKATDFNDAIGQYDITNSLLNGGGYVQSQWEALPGLNILNSVRYDVYSDFENSPSWRNGVTYKIAPTNTTVHASVSSAYRPPTVADLYFPPSFGFPTSNPNLVPETSLGWEVGAQQPFLNDKVSVSATYFHNKIHDFIGLDSNFIPQNFGTVTTQGVELGFDVKPCDQLRFNINYTYLDADDNVNKVRLIERPRHTTNFTAYWTPLAPLTFTAGGSWVVGREAPVTVDQEDYFTLHVAGTWKINDTVSIWARGENVLGESYAVTKFYPALSAGGYGGVQISF